MKCANGLDQDVALRVGLCIECGTAQHSAGRSRCDACHHKVDRSKEEIFTKTCEAFEKCRADGCVRAPMPGRVLCAQCLGVYPCRSAGCDAVTAPGRVLCRSCFGAKAAAAAAAKADRSGGK